MQSVDSYEKTGLLKHRLAGLIVMFWACREGRKIKECFLCPLWSKEGDPFKDCLTSKEHKEMDDICKEHHFLTDKLPLPAHIMLEIFPPEKESLQSRGVRAALRRKLNKEDLEE